MYRPFEMLPTGGLRLHATVAFELLATVAVNCWVCAGSRETEPGLNEMETGGTRVTVALADWVGSAALVAVTVTF